MRLKSLELHGYKTFASQTLFEFAGMITAVVGPNGSGKSNVADSLRWALGEQSYSLLRGKKTEDMIFSGSEQRPRAGMASVTVVFDNSEGWLPIDFSEVSITRRAYRDGQNEYHINGQRVRLKDVSEMLAQSGLAERTYTIIGQGVVDAALSLKAEERRRLFEEAAGIGLYRARREEAERRLDTTKRNLERVEDILAELVPRLRSLERQAKRAIEYEQVRSDLRILLREWYGYHWHQAQKELREARELARRQEVTLNKANGIYRQLDGQMAQARGKLHDLRARLNGWHRELAALHTHREELNTARAVAEERQHSLQEQQHATQAELDRLEEELGFHQERLLAAEGEVTQIEVELSEAREQSAQAHKALQERQHERGAMEERLQQKRQALSADLRKQGDLQARLLERRLVLERLAQDRLDSEVSLNDAQPQATGMQEKLDASLEALHQVRDERKKTSVALQDLRQRTQQAETIRKDLQDKLGSNSAALARLQAQLDVLDQAENALSGYTRGAQALLKAMRDQRLRQGRGALGSLMEVPAELDAVITAALGEYLDALVLSGADGIDSGLDVLVTESARGVLLPLADIASPGKLPSLPDDQGMIGLASNLVKAPSDLQPVLDLLLGRTLVVRDRQAARRILKQVVKSGVEGLRAVTLKGEIFYASGQVLAGGDLNPVALNRPRQRKGLQDEIAAIQERISGIKTQVGQVDAGLKSLREREAQLEKDVEAARSKESSINSAHSQLIMELEATQRQIAWHQERLSRIVDDSRSAESEINTLAASLQQSETQITSARQEIHRQEFSLNDLGLDDLLSQNAHWNVQVAAVERSLTGAQMRRNERSAALKRAQQGRDATLIRVQELQSGLSNLATDKDSHRDDESGLTEHMETLRILIEPAEIELDTMEKEQETLQQSEASARQELATAEHHNAQAKIVLARRQEALETWRRRIEEDFGLVAFDYVEEISGPTPLPLDGMVEQLPRVDQISAELEENLRRQRAQLRRIGLVNPDAQSEYQEVKQRYQFMTEQVEDLHQAQEDIQEVIAELDELMQRELRRTFEAVADEFSILFKRLFGGGSARLILTDPDDMTNTGVDIEARLPGKRSQGLSLLSGGERSLTATALVFSLLKVSPTPFCLLDEVDAMLDEANVGRFRDLLSELSQHTQFIVVTHNRSTVQVADVIYGVTMGRDSTSQVISLKMDEVEKVIE